MEMLCYRSSVALRLNIFEVALGEVKSSLRLRCMKTCLWVNPKRRYEVRGYHVVFSMLANIRVRIYIPLLLPVKTVC